MASGKQRRSIIKAKRTVRRTKAKTSIPARTPKPLVAGSALVNGALLAPYRSYGAPAFVYRDHYVDTSFARQNCGTEEIWTATQQKWWYETAKGYVYSIIRLCRACRRKVYAQKKESRRVHLEGIARKKAGASIRRK